MQSKSQVKERLTEIQLERQAYDEKFNKLHRLLTDTRSSRLPLHRLRTDFQQQVPELRDIARAHLTELDVLKQTCRKLQQEGICWSTQDNKWIVRSAQSIHYVNISNSWSRK